MRILLRYLALKGGEADLEEAAGELGGVMEDVTGRYLPALRLAYPGLWGPVKKPFNMHVLEALLLRLGSEVGLLRYERGAASLAELADELADEGQAEVVRTGPRSPVIGRRGERRGLRRKRPRGLPLDRQGGRLRAGPPHQGKGRGGVQAA